jgi:hypothetical protein
MKQFIVRNNWSLFIKELTNFTMVKMSKFTQNLVKLKWIKMHFGAMIILVAIGYYFIGDIGGY